MAPTEIAGQKQQLRLLGNCLPRENTCIYTLGDLELKLISNEQKQQQQLAAISNKPVSKLSIALGQKNDFKQFPMMKSDNGKYWQISLNNSDNILIFNKLRIAFVYQNKSYYAASEVKF
ncbi:MAG: hypothetical protein KDI92_08385 [Xanthomonadales bacterium]|nr:hypothetical protein [Xanthomonadales bacterium]